MGDSSSLQRLNVDKQSLAAPVKAAVDKFQLVPEFLKAKGLVKHHLDSFNYFVTNQIKQIVLASGGITSEVDPSIYLRYEDLSIGLPSSIFNQSRVRVTPQECRLRDITYAAPVYVDIKYTLPGSSELRPKKVFIGQLPVMLKSCCCVLYGKDDEELARCVECPLDPGGYFIIKGTEKVILIQEQLSKNSIIVDTDKNNCVQASVTSSAKTTESETVIKIEKEKIYLHLNQFTSKVPIMIVMKAMGVESDQEVVQMIGRDPQYSDLLLPSIEDCAGKTVQTRNQALEYLERKVKKSLYPRAHVEKGRLTLGILRDIFLAHIPVLQDNFRPKCIYVAVMLRRIMDAVLDPDAVDDKDYVGNRRLERSGQLLSQLFEDLFKTMNVEAKKKVDKILANKSEDRYIDISQHIKNDAITFGLERALSTGNWDAKRFGMHRKGMTQVLSRLSYIGTLGHMTKVSQQFEKSRKVSRPRALQLSQWGMFCPCDTSKGQDSGLVKNLALMAHVTTDEDQRCLAELV